MKRRQRNFQKSQCIRTMHTPHRLTIRMDTQYLNAASEELSIPSGHELSTRFHILHGSILIPNYKKLSEILDHRALREFRFLMVPMVSCSPNYPIATLENIFEYLRRIRHSSRREIPCQLIAKSISIPRFAAYSHLSMMTEDALTKQKSKLILMEHTGSAAFHKLSLMHFPEKAEHDQLNRNVRLLISSNDIPRDNFMIHIAVSHKITPESTEVDVLTVFDRSSTGWGTIKS